MRGITLGLIAMLALTAMPVASAQDVLILAMDMTLEGSNFVMEPNSLIEIRITVTDRSQNGAGYLDPQASGGAMPNQVSFATVYESDPGWTVSDPLSISIRPGETKSTVMAVILGPAVKSPYLPVTIISTMNGQFGAPVQTTADILVYTTGISGFSALASPGFQQVKPDSFVDYKINIQNLALISRTFDIVEGDNNCGLKIAYDSGFKVRAKETSIAYVSIAAPNDKAYYLSELCSAKLQIVPRDNPDGAQTVILSMQVDGLFVDIGWIITAFVVLIIFLLLLLLLLKRKRKVEEEILGKPQKPWTIPAEALYLEELKVQDPKAWYLVRNYLMPEEYRSSLAWYYAYKAATKGTRKKERLILGQEKRLDRVRMKTNRQIHRLESKAEKYSRAEEESVVRKAKRVHKKQVKSWQAEADKIQNKHDAKSAKLNAQYEKAVQRAAKKGQPDPEAPSIGKASIPPRPEFVAPKLDSKPKRQVRVDKFVAKREKEILKVEAKGDKKYAKVLGKVQGKVRKLAKKLDDPEFEAAHAELFA